MIGPEVQVPDFTQAVVGFRRFKLVRKGHNYRLQSPYQEHEWPQRSIIARCSHVPKIPEGLVVPVELKPHAAPAKDCGCGIYAYFAPCPVDERRDHFHQLLSTDPWESVEALITVSGRVEVHSRGMRAERAQIEALGLNSTLNDDERAGLAEIAREWDIPLVPQDQLPKLATEFGAELPDDAKPTVPPAPASATRWSGHCAEPTPRRRGPERWTVWFNLLLAAGQVGAWAAWHNPINLFSMAISASVAAWYAGRRKETSS